MCLICFFIFPAFAQRRGAAHWSQPKKTTNHAKLRTKVKHKARRGTATHTPAATPSKLHQGPLPVHRQPTSKRSRKKSKSTVSRPQHMQPESWKYVKTSHPVSTETHVQIVNLPDQPVVHLQTQAPTESAVVPARMVNETEFMSVVFPGGIEARQMFVPPALNSQSPVGYRGIPLNDISQLKNILENGLEARHATDGKMFFPGSCLLLYSFPNT